MKTFDLNFFLKEEKIYLRVQLPKDVQIFAPPTKSVKMNGTPFDSVQKISIQKSRS